MGGSKEPMEASGEELVSSSPIDGSPLATVRQATAQDYEKVMDRAREAMGRWIMTPAPVRGQIVREIGDALRASKEDLGRLVSLEMGKILDRGPGRGSGDDRCGRLRRRPVPPALWLDHAFGAALPPPLTSSGCPWARSG